MSALVLLVGVGLIAATAWLVARRLVLPTLTGALLAAYVVGFAEIVTVALVLSVVDSLRASTILGTVALVFSGAVAWSLWRPASPGPHHHPSAVLRAARGDPVLAVLGVVVVVGLAYAVALAVLTPPNDWDAMTYHLARAGFWLQQEAVGYVPDTHVLRINVNPPNAEIGALFTMSLSGGDRYVGLVQLTALLATFAGTYGISRLLGLEPPAALFGPLLLVTTPVVLLQASTALNDLVVASFLVASAYFLLGERRRELALGSLALALAIGTKFVALIALPLLALVALAGQPRRRRGEVAVAGVGGVALGSYWLVVNLVESGSIDGHAADVLDQRADRDPAAIVARATRLLLSFADGMDLGRDLLVFAIAGTVFLATAVALEWRRSGGRRLGWLAVAAFAVVAAAPLVVPVVRTWTLRGYEEAWRALGRQELAALDTSGPWSPSSVFSYYGPLGAVLLVVGTLLAVQEVRRRALRPLALVLVSAPFVFALLVALALVYDPWRGRFFVFAMALAAATWGVLLSRRWLAWGLTSVATASLLLAFVHSEEKPAGIRLFEERTESGVWGKPRHAVQTWTRPDGTAEIVGFFAEEPLSGRVGLRLEEDDWVYPYFGRTLERDVVFVPVEASLDGLDWLVLGAGRVEQPEPEWSLAVETADGRRLYRRAAPG